MTDLTRYHVTTEVSRSRAEGFLNKLYKHNSPDEHTKAAIQELEKRIDRFDRLSAGNIKSFKVEKVTDLARLIIDVRIARRLSQLQMAELLDLHISQIGKWELVGYVSLQVERIEAILNALGTDYKDGYLHLIEPYTPVKLIRESKGKIGRDKK